MGNLRDQGFSYEVFRRLNVPVPLVSYVRLSINGKEHGLYLAVEEIADSFLDRVYNGEGVLYKPENKELELTAEEAKNIRERGLIVPEGAQGADFVYIDDRLESYPDIFDNAETDANEEDNRRVVNALRKLSENEDPETYLDTDGIIRFFAGQSFLLNYDGYIGPMLHNYYLYENDGKLSLLPWDFNSSFGTFSLVLGEEAMREPAALINSGIDMPLRDTTEDARPMWRWIAQDERCMEIYRQALDELSAGLADSKDFENEVDEVYEMLLPYVEADPTAFYTVSQYETAVGMLKKFVRARAGSIRRQLAGELSRDSGMQNADDWEDTSGISLEVLR